MDGRRSSPISPRELHARLVSAASPLVVDATAVDANEMIIAGAIRGAPAAVTSACMRS